MLATFGSETTTSPSRFSTAWHCSRMRSGCFRCSSTSSSRTRSNLWPCNSLDHRPDAVVQVGREIALEHRLGRRHAIVNARDAVSVLRQLGGEESFAAPDVQNVVLSASEAPRIVVAGILALFNRIMNEIFLEFRETPHRPAGLLVAPHRPDHVPGILEPVHVADLVAVISRNRHFLDPVALVMQLDDDLGVEVEIIRHPREIDLPQRVQIVGAIAAVKLRQIHPQRAVFEDSSGSGCPRTCRAACRP